jgi:hypothetical protein
MVLQSFLLGALSLLIAVAASTTPVTNVPEAQWIALIVEIIRGLFFVIAAIVAVLAKEIYDTRSLTKLSSARRKAVAGTWKEPLQISPLPTISR